MLAVELPYYALGFGGSQLEDTVVIKDGQAGVTSMMERDLRELPVD